MKFKFSMLFSPTMLRALFSGLLPRLMSQHDFQQAMPQMTQLSKTDYPDRVKYLLSVDKAFLKLLKPDVKYVVTMAKLNADTIIVVYDAIDNSKNRIPDDVKRKRGLTPIHTARTNARDRCRYLLRNGDLNLPTRSQLHFLYNPGEPYLVYRPDWGDAFENVMKRLPGRAFC